MKTKIIEYSYNRLDEIIHEIRTAIYKTEELGFKREDIKVYMPYYLIEMMNRYHMELISTGLKIAVKYMDGCELVCNYQNNVAISIHRFDIVSDKLPFIIDLNDPLWIDTTEDV